MSKTLTTNASSYYLKTGVAVRLFVHIPTANLFLGTQAVTIGSTTYADSLKNNGTITRSIKPFGGMAEVSGVDISNLELGEDISFCTEATGDNGINPTGTKIHPAGAGRLMSGGESGDDTYATVRGEETAEFSEHAITVGQRYYAHPSLGDIYYTYRGCIQYKIPDTLTSCEDAALSLYGLNDNSTTDSELYVIEGNWSSWDDDSKFSDFDGHESGATAYDSAEATGSPAMNETWRTNSFSTSTTTPNYIRFNQYGRERIVANAGSTIKLLILSKRDFDGTEPSGDEFVKFSADAPTLDLRYNTYTLYNQEAIIYLAFAAAGNDLSGLTAVTDMQRLWTGVIDDYSITTRTLNLKLKQNDFKENLTIPQTIFDDGDYPYIHDSSIGKPIPIIYGDFMGTLRHKSGIGYACKEGTSNYFGLGDYVKVYVTRNSITSGSGDKISGVIANHLLKEMDHAGYLWESAINSFVVLTADLTDDSSATIAAAYLSKGSDTSKFPYSMTVIDGLASINPVICKIPGDVTNAYMTNPLYVIDSNASNETTLQKTGSWLSQGDFYFGQDWGVSSLITGYWVVCQCRADSYDASASGFSTTVDAEVKTYFTIDGQVYYEGAAAIDVKEILVYFASTNTDTVYIKNLGLWRGYKREIADAYYIRCKGRPDDASGTITGSASSLIENPSHVIESIARDEMSMTDSEIDTAAFDTLATDLSGWKYAFQLLERKGTREIIGGLAEQGRTKAYWDESNLLTAQAFDKNDAFPNAASATPDVPGNLDIFDEDASPTSGAFTTHPILSPEFSDGGVEDFEMHKMGMDEVKNDFVLHYKKNYATGEFEETLYITNGSGAEASVETNINASYLENNQDLTKTGNLKQLCADSYNEIGTTNTWEYDAWAIRDEATATKLLQHYVERLTKNRWICRFTSGLNALAVELGDFVNVRHDRIQDIFGTPTMNVKAWEVIRVEHDLNSHNITFEVIEV